MIEVCYGSTIQNLTIGVVLFTSAMAGCSSTSAVSSWAVQDEAKVSASSELTSAASVVPVTSSEPVASGAAAIYTPSRSAANPTESPSGSVSSSEPALLGDTAPKHSDLSFTGKGNTWCSGSGKKSTISGTESMKIGSGFSITLAIIPTRSLQQGSGGLKTADRSGVCCEWGNRTTISAKDPSKATEHF